MSWFESSTNQTAAARKVLGLAIAADFDFPSGHTRVSTWNGPLTIGGNSYVGVGIFGSVSALRDGISTDAQRRSYRLNLVNTTLASIGESDLQGCRNRSVTEYLCFIDPDTGQLFDTPEITFEGLMSLPRRVEGPNPSVEIVCVSRLIMLEKSDVWRWTDAHQQGAFYDGDLGFNHVDRNETNDIFWGGYPVRPGAPRGGHPANDTGHVQEL
jgi:hypothetical protein